MRISDWSSDVCSSDLLIYAERIEPDRSFESQCHPRDPIACGNLGPMSGTHMNHLACMRVVSKHSRDVVGLRLITTCRTLLTVGARRRFLVLSSSEEHTSELPSLMRHSYYVLCFKHKPTNHYLTTSNY